jgi:hypothetical protein
VLAVRANEKERMPDRRPRRREIEPDQIVVPVELEAAQLAAFSGGPREKGEQTVPAAPLAPANEEDACVRQSAALGAEERLQLLAQRRTVDRVVRPDAAVLEQDPGVDAAGCRSDRLGMSQRGLGT